MKTRIVLIGMALLGWTVSARANVIYSAAGDYEPTNPNGVWSYGTYLTPGAPTTFQAFQHLNQNLGGNSGLNYWYNTGDPSIVRDSGAACTFANINFVPGELTMDCAGGASVVRWTAPQAETIDLDATFLQVQTNSGGPPAASLWQNSTMVNITLCDLVTPVHDVYSLTVAAGDTIDFVVGEAGAGNHAGTRLDATITPTPEPGTIVLLLTGLFGLLAYAWRKRR